MFLFFICNKKITLIYQHHKAITVGNGWITYPMPPEWVKSFSKNLHNVAVATLSCKYNVSRMQ